jgi:tRNA dimethylallyltransferase
MDSIITIIGPTASGKTELAVALAIKLDGEIVSADSRQVYKYLNIGTAKPTGEERRRAAFHLIDFVEPNEDYSCGQFSRDAEERIRIMVEKGKTPIVCGGTGLYIKALYEPMHRLPRSTRTTKERLAAELKNRGLEFLYRRLREVDPAWAKKVKPNDRQRILRGLEIHVLTGRPLSDFLTGPKPYARYRPRYIGLGLSRAALYERIDRRFDRMMEAGLVDEVRGILKLGYPADSNALRTIGYREIIDYLAERIARSEAVDRAKRNTRNFAKRQMTWFGKVLGIKWLDGDKPLETLLTEVMKLGS